MTPPIFDSYAQNGEDVVLWRALHGIGEGRYIDVGANHPSRDSVTKAFYDRGWSGITVEPDPQFAALQREQRPRDILAEAAVTPKDDETVTLHIVDGTGLSTLDDAYGELHANSGHKTHDHDVRARRLDTILQEAGWSADDDIHFMSVDTEGSERGVLESIDLAVWRPWVLVIEATEPNSTESTREAWESLVTDAGYQFCLFDGLSCFYVAGERREQFGHALSYPACVLDKFRTTALRERDELLRERDESLREHDERLHAAHQRLEQLVEDVVRWRAEALTRWSDAMADGPVATALRTQLEALQGQHATLSHQHHLVVQEIAALHESSSWRLTKPLRTVSAKLAQARGEG